jgi:hypothetical protein
LRLLNLALALKRKGMNRAGYWETLNEIAVLHRDGGRLDMAVELHAAALRGMRDVHDPHGQSVVLNDFGYTLRLAGRSDDARALHIEALLLAERGGYLMRQADARDGLGHCLVLRDPAGARQHWEEALTLYRQMDVPKQHDLEATLRDRPQVLASARE